MYVYAMRIIEHKFIILYNEATISIIYANEYSNVRVRNDTCICLILEYLIHINLNKGLMFMESTRII